MAVEKVTPITSKELLIEIYGIDSVQQYEAVKAGSMRLGDQLAKLLLQAVGGRAGRHGEPFDGRTRLGEWEFCLQKNTKNSAGNFENLTRAPGRCVQILENPNPGWISAEEFLIRHGKEPTVLLDVINEMRGRHALHHQMRLSV